MEIKSRYYRQSRRKSLLLFVLKKIFQMASVVLIGEYLLLHVIVLSLSEQHPIQQYYHNMPAQIVNLAVNEKPILRIARAYDTIKNGIEFDNVIQNQYPAQIKGSRLDFRTLNLQDKEGAKVGYVVKF